MANYLSITEEDRKKMLETIGVKSLDELFSDIPRELWIRKLELPDGKTQQEVIDFMTALSELNTTYRVILRGAGAYWHYIPSIVKNLSSRSEFVTAYTPYQAEMSQGILQSIFEYQSMICSLTGMDVSNASVYSGATAAADGILMCGGKRNVALIPDNIRPDTLEVIKTYLFRRGMSIKLIANKNGVIDYDTLKSNLNDTVACVYFEQPNYFGLLEDSEEISRLAHEVGAKTVMGINPIAAALLKSPADCGADIAVGDAGCLGLPLSFGGPYIGFMACTNKEVRRLPGRIVGETTDHDGNRAYVLTLQAREQHIRREKAMSNICSNQAYCALIAAMYLTSMGPNGLREVATACTSMAHYAAEEMEKAGIQLKYNHFENGELVRGEFFHEFVTVHKTKASKILARLEKEGILGGLEIGKNEILWCFTEMVKKEDVDRVVDILRRAV